MTSPTATIRTFASRRRNVSSSSSRSMVGAVLLALTTLLLLPSTSVYALDIFLRSYECDTSLPIYADEFLMWCGGGDGDDDGEDEKRDNCSFGEVANFEGALVYSDVENTGGVQDNVIWSKADLKFLSLTYHLFEDYQLDLCHAVIEPAEMDEQNQNDENDEDANQCPADGLYNYAVTYMLPKTENQAAGWLATGWAGSGRLEFFSAEGGYEQNLIGSCTFDIGTGVTANGAGFSPPTAATTSGILIGLFALLMLACFYCACCRPNARKPKSTDHDATRSLMENESVLTPGSHRGRAAAAAGGGGGASTAGSSVPFKRGSDAPTVDGSITHPATNSQGDPVQIY